MSASRTVGDTGLAQRLAGAANRVALPVVLVVMAGLLAAVAFEAMRYGFWRHDAIRYVSSFENGLIYDSRWVLYLLFPLLKLVPPFVAWALCFGLTGLFFHLIARQLGFDRSEAAAIAMVLSASTGFIAQLHWPAITLPGAIVLLFAYWLSRRVGALATLTIASILSFAVIQSFVYVLPLLYVDRMVSGSWRDRLVWTLKILAYWALAFVLAYAVSQAIVYLLSGDVMQIHDWRQPHKADSLPALMENIDRNVDFLDGHIRSLFPAGWLALAAFVAIFAAFLRPGATPRSLLALGLVCLTGAAIGIAHYVLTLPIGIIVQLRTVWPLYVGGAVMFLSLACIAPKRLVVVAAALTIGIPSLLSDYEITHWFRLQTQARLEVFRQAMPKPGNAYTAAFVDVRDFDAFEAVVNRVAPDWPPQIEPLSLPLRLAPALMELGVANVYICTQAALDLGYCELLVETPDMNDCSDQQGQVCVLKETQNGQLLLKIRG
ncbi:hypothetical protein [Oricola sp.]|uniref:hypothetical protein n=1 Tax=Oricola sp. TaxID=1979950 RepID=UPI0025D07222|nr:hypothetical protein [Oricola sp.]MCI5076737.1 hypothetical protein [Oricola sp.]